MAKKPKSEVEATEGEAVPPVVEVADEYEVLTEGAIIGDNRFDDGSDGGTPCLPLGHKVMLTGSDAETHQKCGVGLRKVE